MDNHMKLLYTWLLALAAFGNAAAADFLAPEQAFKPKAELRDERTLVVSWEIAPGYHLYRERLGFSGARLGTPVLPEGVRKFDDNFNKEMETYHGTLAVSVPVEEAGKAFTLKVAYQGCADAGLCYQPMEQAYLVEPGRFGALALATSAAPVEDEVSMAQRTLRGGSLWRIGGAFLLFGLLLSFTPCVLPMVPILSSIIVGEGRVSRARGVLLAGAYCLGMALVYTALGVGAGLAGEGLAGALQKPWVLLTFGALLVGLALSMFDVYQLQLPSALQSRLGTGQGGGRFIGVFVMGALSALIVGPCVAGPLAGALLYISQTGNAWIGGWALFAMACGMSVPLMLTGLSAGSLLPRAGAWMIGVKQVFGLLLIGVAVWMVAPVFPTTVAMALWGALAILCALFLWPGNSLRKALAVLFMVGGLFELAGAASSGTDVLQPLAHLRGGGSAPGPEAARFERVRSVDELERVLASAGAPVLLDFYADWCVACKEMERLTFSEAKTSAAMKKMRLVQVDVTANNEMDRALLKKFNLFGPPGMILFNAAGKEIEQGRLIGFVPPERFVEHLLRAQLP
jgi:thiol:disulfide interchange protein DsbD